MAADRDVAGRALSRNVKSGNTEARKQDRIQRWEVRFAPSFKEPSATSLRITT